VMGLPLQALHSCYGNNEIGWANISKSTHGTMKDFLEKYLYYHLFLWRVVANCRRICTSLLAAGQVKTAQKRIVGSKSDIQGSIAALICPKGSSGLEWKLRIVEMFIMLEGRGVW